MRPFGKENAGLICEGDYTSCAHLRSHRKKDISPRIYASLH